MPRRAKNKYVPLEWLCEVVGKQSRPVYGPQWLVTEMRLMQFPSDSGKRRLKRPASVLLNPYTGQPLYLYALEQYTPMMGGTYPAELVETNLHTLGSVEGGPKVIASLARYKRRPLEALALGQTGTQQQRGSRSSEPSVSVGSPSLGRPMFATPIDFGAVADESSPYVGMRPVTTRPISRGDFERLYGRQTRSTRPNGGRT